MKKLFSLLAVILCSAVLASGSMPNVQTIISGVVFGSILIVLDILISR